MCLALCSAQGRCCVARALALLRFAGKAVPAPLSAGCGREFADAGTTPPAVVLGEFFGRIRPTVLSEPSSASGREVDRPTRLFCSSSSVLVNLALHFRPREASSCSLHSPQSPGRHCSGCTAGAVSLLVAARFYWQNSSWWLFLSSRRHPNRKHRLRPSSRSYLRAAHSLLPRRKWCCRLHDSR